MVNGLTVLCLIQKNVIPLDAGDLIFSLDNCGERP